jgi:hypothetical protein
MTRPLDQRERRDAEVAADLLEREEVRHPLTNGSDQMSLQHRYLVLVVLAISSLAASCRSPEDVGETMMIVMTTPTDAQIAVGDTLVLSLRVSRTPSELAIGTIRWKSEQPATVRLDTVVAADQRVIARGVATGRTTLTYDLQIEAQRVTGSIPISVSARP